MATIAEQFEVAAQAAQKLAKKPDNQTLLQLYALYKQATSGDVAGKKPGFGDFVGQAKYDAWAKLKGKGSEAAMQEYIALVDRLQKS
jgi:diazepam-binding inhibitor (GABA receptor modulator, acyl-CoA-binding protein)